MAFTYTTAVFEARLPGMEKLILWVLAEYCNEKRNDGRCWPGQSAIARDAGVSYRTVQRTVDKLIEKKLVTITGSHKSRGGDSHEYTLNLDGIIALGVVRAATVEAKGTGGGEGTVAGEPTPLASERLHQCSQSDATTVAGEPTGVVREADKPGRESGIGIQEGKSEKLTAEEETAAASASSTDSKEEKELSDEEVALFNLEEDVKAVTWKWEQTYGELNGNKEQFGNSLRPFIKKYNGSILYNVTKWAQADEFWSKRIHTPKGYFRCLSGDLINQWKLDNPNSPFLREFLHQDEPEIEVQSINVEEL